MRIFLVDDDEIIRQGMRKIIEKNNSDCTVVGEAADGELALREMSSCGEIDLIITDIRMPIMDGIELIKKVRETDKVVKIIVVSGFDDFSYVRNAFIDGAVDYLLKPINKKNLLDLLAKIAKDIKEESKENSLRSESHNLLVAKTLDSTMTRKSGNTEEEIINLQKIGVEFDANYFVMSTSIDNYYKYKYEQIVYEGQLESLLQSMQEKIAQNKDYKAIHYINKNEIVSLIILTGEEDNALLSAQFYKVVKEALQDDLTISMGISNNYVGIENAYKAYEEAKEALGARFYLEHDNRIEYSEIKNKMQENTLDIKEKIPKLINYLELYNYPKLRDTLEVIFLDMNYIKPSVFKKKIGNMLEILMLQVKGFQEAVIDYDHEYKLGIEYITTFNELKSYINAMMKHATIYMRNERDKRSKKRIEVVKAFIDEHYMDSITLNDIADYIELNPSYFSNLFKKEVGMNFSEYLLEIRMNTAKKLLKNPKLKIYEIGHQVGYEDAVSFGRAFKNKLGMSPKEYRNTVY